MVNCFQDIFYVLCWGLLLIQGLLQSWDHIAHNVYVVHAGVFHSEVRSFSWLLVCCLEKLFETNPRPLDCCSVILFSNRQSELACSLKYHIHDIHGLVLRVRHSGDVGKLENLFNGREYGPNWFPRIVHNLLDDVFAFKDIEGHQLTVVVLEASKHVRHGVID